VARAIASDREWTRDRHSRNRAMRHNGPVLGVLLITRAGPAMTGFAPMINDLAGARMVMAEPSAHRLELDDAVADLATFPNSDGRPSRTPDRVRRDLLEWSGDMRAPTRRST
jgi:uncharacterized NAD(P)/FAD-binding protein YdhS